MLRCTLMLLIFLLAPLSSFAEGTPWTHSFYFDNDLFIGTDSDYTNGIKYSLISPDLAPDAPLSKTAKVTYRILELFHEIPLIKNAPAETGHKLELAFGQNIYTPRDTSRFDLIKDDRPYAGYSYLSAAYHRKSDEGKRWSQMDTAEIQLGMVGPSSLGEDAQKFVHQVRGLQRPNGWDNQLKDEPAVTLAFERKWLYHPSNKKALSADGIAHTGITLGNVMTYFNAGLELRAGWNIPRSFAVSLIRPAATTWCTKDSGLSLYLFGVVNGRAVLRDIFLDGNSFRDSHSVDKKPLVADLSAGITTRYQRISVSLSYTQRTREFDQQPKHHGYGSMVLSYDF